MANFGDNMRELVNSKEKKQKEIVKRKLNRSTKSLINNTPIGQIRFKSISFYNVERRLFGPQYGLSPCDVDYRLTKMVNEYFLAFDYSTGIDPLTYRCKVRSSPQHILSCILGTHIAPPVGYKTITVVYANNPQSNPNCAKDFISYCFESSMLPTFQYELKRKIKLYKTVQSPLELNFYYEAILTTLEFYNMPISDAEVKAIFTELCEKNGIMLSKWNPDIKCFYIELSL